MHASFACDGRLDGFEIHLRLGIAPSDVQTRWQLPRGEAGGKSLDGRGGTPVTSGR